MPVRPAPASSADIRTGTADATGGDADATAGISGVADGLPDATAGISGVADGLPDATAGTRGAADGLPNATAGDADVTPDARASTHPTAAPLAALLEVPDPGRAAVALFGDAAVVTLRPGGRVTFAPGVALPLTVEVVAVGGSAGANAGAAGGAARALPAVPAAGAVASQQVEDAQALTDPRESSMHGPAAPASPAPHDEADAVPQHREVAPPASTAAAAHPVRVPAGVLPEAWRAAQARKQARRHARRKGGSR